MNQLSIVEYRNRRVLTTPQLAESYGASAKMISNNFNRNQDRYMNVKHFFALRGDELRDFRANHQIEDLPNNVNVVYLWTEKGAWLHAKSLNTDEAWDAYEMLVDDYYDAKKQQLPMNNTKLLLETALKHETKIEEIESDVTYLKGSMRVDSLQQQDLQKAARLSVVQALGGKDAPAYEELSKKVFPALWNEFKNHFKVPRYPDLPKVKFDEAERFIKMWRPYTSLQMKIDACNSQMKGL